MFISIYYLSLSLWLLLSSSTFKLFSSFCCSLSFLSLKIQLFILSLFFFYLSSNVFFFPCVREPQRFLDRRVLEKVKLLCSSYLRDVRSGMGENSIFFLDLSSKSGWHFPAPSALISKIACRQLNSHYMDSYVAAGILAWTWLLAPVFLQSASLCMSRHGVTCAYLEVHYHEIFCDVLSYLKQDHISYFARLVTCCYINLSSNLKYFFFLTICCLRFILILFTLNIAVDVLVFFFCVFWKSQIQILILKPVLMKSFCNFLVSLQKVWSSHVLYF